MVFKVHGFSAENPLQTLQLRLRHTLPYIILFRMNGKAFPVIMVFQGILQGIMLSPYVTFKVIYRSPGTRKIFPVCQDQILYIVCGQRLFYTFDIYGTPFIQFFPILKFNAFSAAVVHCFINSFKCRHISVAVTVCPYFLLCISIHNRKIVTVSKSVRGKGNGIINIRLTPALKTGIYLRFMAVNIPHGFHVYVIIFHFIPVRLMVILKKVFPVYRCIEEIAVLHGISHYIYIIPGFPFIHLYTFLPVNGNPVTGLLDMMSRSFFLHLLLSVFILFLHGTVYHLIISDHINQISMGIYVFLRQLTVNKKSAVFRIRYEKSVLCHCHKAVTHALPAVRILVGIKSNRRL